MPSGVYLKKLQTWREDAPLYAGRADGPFVVRKVRETGMWEVWRSDNKTVAVLPTEEWAIQTMRDEAAKWRAAIAERVYFIGTENRLGRMVKIGTSANPEHRLVQLQLHSPVPLSILAVTDGGVDKEGDYHWKFRRQRQYGEWFKITPRIRTEIERLSG